MKKIIFLLSAAFLFISMPAFAQNTFEKAKDTNAAGRSAVQSQSDTDARNIGNQAWDSAYEGGGTSSTGYGRKTVSLIGGNENIDQKKDEKPCFDKNIVPADITPWKNEYRAMFATFIPSLALVFVAGIIATRSTSIAKKVALPMAITAAAGFMAVLALAIVIMTKYGQKALGGMWVALAAIGLALCAAVIAASIDVIRKGFWVDDRWVLTEYLTMITVGISLPLALGMGFIHSNSNNINKKYQEEQICTNNPEHEVCKPDGESSESGSLL